MTRVRRDGTTMSDKLANALEGGKGTSCLSMYCKKSSHVRKVRRSIERVACKDQVRSAKAIQIKSTRGFA